MNILITGGSGTFSNNLLIKLRKEGHRVSVLSGSRFSKKEDYQKHFELYKFPYDANCINEVFESAAPDVTIFMGAFDTNFKWKNEESDAVRYSGALANILMGYAMLGKGRFIYLSSNEVFGDNYSSDISEDTMTTPNGFKAQAIAQGEAMCEGYRKHRDMDIVTVRLDHVYNMPQVREDINDTLTSMCLEALEEKTIHFVKDKEVSLLYENDAVEALYKIVSASKHDELIYHISSGNALTEEEVANMVRDAMNPECDVISTPGVKAQSVILDGSRFDNEFEFARYVDLALMIKRICAHMKRKGYVFMTEEEEGLPFSQRLKKRLGWFLKAIVPFIENIVVFILCVFLASQSAQSDYLAKLDIFLLYVLLFSVLSGQQQAAFSALLSVLGYFYLNGGLRNGYDLLLDSNTYVWIAQIFIVGLAVGYLRDQIVTIKKENIEENEYLKQQVDDISVINETNVRVKNILETQVVNQADSIGMIYGITASLDQYSPEEVLFYAAETVGKVVKSDDIAIYQVANRDYARLFSSTSVRARSLGNSIKYSDMEEFYEDISSNRVYINRGMDSKYPQMAYGILENGELQMIVMVWGLSWENMTLGQANRLTVVSALIQNAVLRANRYLEALEAQRYEGDSKMLERESFKSLVSAFLKAETKGLTECSVVRIDLEGKDRREVVAVVEKSLRQSDYLGSLDDNAVYALLSNTSERDAQFVLNRFIEKGLDARLIEGGISWN
ncbi:MAG: NAD(P)-dependent oxidoreductase [Lachnospiraceae bacterium]|nr:NAD(P)-dependent oxidoreductase [Lachnospiraceae bacterium]